MFSTSWYLRGLSALSLCVLTLPVAAQSFRVQCPQATTLHPNGSTPDEANHPGLVKCQHIAGTDGFATMADGTQTYLFGFGSLSGVDQIKNGLPGTQTAAAFNKPYTSDTAPGGTNSPTLDTDGAVVDTAAIMNLGVLSANEPAPLMAIDEDDEFFLTLSNVGQIMRPDLFEQHTVHFHGYPNASSFFDGVPDASVAINIMGSFTYYYTAPDAGTYFWHCHITPPEHLQMGMVGQLYVRPRQNGVSSGVDLGNALYKNNRKAPGNPDGVTCSDILCTGQTPLPAAAAADSGHRSFVAKPAGGVKYAYNDGDGSTQYDVEFPIQLMGFDPNFHYVGMTFNPEAFADMKDKYFMISGRGYPDTINTDVDNGLNLPRGSLYTLDSDGASRSSQPLPT